MNNRKMNTQHPLAQPTHARIDMCYEGEQEEIMHNSLTLTKQSAEQLATGEHVLYINTLASPKAIAQVAEKISERTAAKVLSFSASCTPLIQKLEFLRNLVETKKVRVIVVNSIDWAARSSNQKKAFVHFLRQMRDDHDCQVIVYTFLTLPRDGSYAHLRWLCDTTTPIGQWRWERPGSYKKTYINSNVAVQHFMEEMEGTRAVEPVAKSHGPEAFEIMPLHEFFAAPPLKINDLQPQNERVVVEEEELIEEEELELV